MAKTIRLTESELKNMIIESVQKILNEGINPTNDSNWSNYPMTESILNEYKSSKKGYSTTTVDIDLFYIEFPEPLNNFMENNIIPDTIEVEISYLYNEYTPATYWQPAEGGDFEYYCSDVLTQPFENVIPQEMMQTFIDTIAEYVDDNIDSLFERANISSDDYGPDPDEAYERRRDSRYED